ncbi:MAG: cyclic nucleotide-binding domain-containing protein [Deltaproteobacteria bacterium]|nr:cyclic nucleotide-binding domain-containing protein [Deltaproteobacteria bacterium]MBW2340070.1 cyclic nucleotide-binding domain-containing protein [Deltaproteobacteria bacterium]
MKETKVIKQGKIQEPISDFLLNTPLFDELKTNEIKNIAKHLSFIELSKDDILFKEGEKGNCVCFVVEGTLDVIKESLTGESVIITALHRGRSIGEMSIIDDFPRSATVKARTQVKLVILTREDFDLLLEENPQVGIKILKKISRLLSLNLRKTSSRLADYMLPLT